MTKKKKLEEIPVKELKPLYKLSTKGKLLVWRVKMEPGRRKHVAILTVYNGVDGGRMRMHAESVDEGKSIGKKNETTILQQAEKEMHSKFEKQLKKGYVVSKKAALAGKIDKIIKGGISPMLAEKFQDHKNKIEYPVAGQPKLNGMRCIAIQDKKFKWTLWTRTRKQIHSCPHVVRALESFYKKTEQSPKDGELYNHAMKFETLMSIVRKQKPSKDSSKVQFHIFDSVENEVGFKKRHKILSEPFKKFAHHQYGCLVLVPTEYNIKSEKHAIGLQKIFTRKKFEGLMLRKLKSVYKNKRSPSLIKFKIMQDAEFKIEKFTSGEDDTVIVHFHVKGSKVLGKATMEGKKEKLQHLVDDSWLYRGKKVTVRFQEYSTKNKLPLFPVGVRIRENE